MISISDGDVDDEDFEEGDEGDEYDDEDGASDENIEEVEDDSEVDDGENEEEEMFDYEGILLLQILFPLLPGFPFLGVTFIVPPYQHPMEFMCCVIKIRIYLCLQSKLLRLIYLP